MVQLSNRLSRILGHATLQMTARYGHLRTEDLHEEMERVAQKRSQDRQKMLDQTVWREDQDSVGETVSY